MRYYSTLGKSQSVDLREAVLAGHAPDGGLYMPERIPCLPKAFFNNMPDMSLPDIAYVVANTLFGDSVDSESLSRLAQSIYSFDVPLCRLTPDIAVLELFHGPTGSFNDIGARFLAGLLPHLAPDPAHPVNFLMATAGDSGASVASALHNLPGARVTILYPAKKLSAVQQAQLSSLGGNVTAVEVSGGIDECRAMVERAFADHELVADARLTPASSTNIARFLPQIIYYFHAYARMRQAGDTRKVVVSVPGGNLGNLAAGLVAKRMGLPVHRFVVSNNVNATFVHYLRDGVYTPHAAVDTSATSLDVSSPSNFPRIVSLYEGDIDALRADVTGRAYTDDSISDAVRLCRDAEYMVENGSATAWLALRDSIDPAYETGVFFAIASPEKTSSTHDYSPSTIELLARPRSVMKIGRSYDALVKILLT